MVLKRAVGEHLLMALIEEPAIAHHSPSLLVRLKASLADHQAAALHSFKAYEATISSNGAFEQSPNGGSLRLNSWTLPGVPVFLPFHAARDSRNIFKTPVSCCDLLTVGMIEDDYDFALSRWVVASVCSLVENCSDSNLLSYCSQNMAIASPCQTSQVQYP